MQRIRKCACPGGDCAPLHQACAQEGLRGHSERIVESNLPREKNGLRFCIKCERKQKPFACCVRKVEDRTLWMDVVVACQL